MNGRIYDPALGRFMTPDPFVQFPTNLQSYNRYSYVLNNPLGYIDPSGYSPWTKIRGIVIRVVAAVADYYGCSGYCSTAVGAYQGYQQGGTAGGVIGGIAGYTGYYLGANYALTDQAGNILWSNVAIGAATNAALGCASASAAGGSCGRGALTGSVGTVGAAYGFMGSIIAGCAAGKIGGGSCSDGAFDALGTYAVYSAIGYAIESQRTQSPEDYLFSRAGGMRQDGQAGADWSRVPPDFATDPKVAQEMNRAWDESNPHAPEVPRGQPGSLKIEQGGWIVRGWFGGEYDVIRVPPGTRDSLNLGSRPIFCFCSAVGTFHTHPNTLSEGYRPEPSTTDVANTRARGVPSVIKSHDGDYYVHP